MEEEDLGADTLEWSERGIGGADTSDVYFASRSSHSDTLSESSPDGEDSLDALLGMEDAYVGWQATASSFRPGQRKTRRRESVTAKDGHRDATETYFGRSGCCRRKSPENHVDPNIPFKLGTRGLCSVEIRPHSSTEKLKLDLHHEQSSLQAVCTETQVGDRTEPYSLHVQSQHNTDIFDTKVNSAPDAQKVKLHVQPEERNPNRLNESTDSETCVIHIDTTGDKIVETQQQQSTHGYETRSLAGNTDRKSVENTGRGRLEICNAQDVEVENIELLNTYSVDKNTGLDRCNSDCNDRHHRHRQDLEHQCIINEDREIQAIKVHSEDKWKLFEGVGHRTRHKIENFKDNTCVAGAHFTDVRNAQTFDSTCTPAHSKSETKYTHKKDPQLTTEIVASPNITEACDTKTNSVSHSTKSELRDTIDTHINVLAHKMDICCSQTLCEESPNRGLSESHPQVCSTVTKPQDKAWVSGFCFRAEQFGCVGTTTEGTKPPGTVNEICSSITFSTETTASFPLDTCATELTMIPKVSTLASPVLLADSDREDLTDRQPDQKQPQSTRLQSLQIPGQTQDLILNHLDRGGAKIELPTHRQLHSVDKFLERTQSGSVEPGPDSTQTQSDICKESEECLPHHSYLNNLLFSSGNRRAEDTSSLSSENFEGERRRVGSPCSLLQPNMEQEVEDSYGLLDQEEIVEAVNKVNLPQSQLGTTKLSEHSELKVIPRAITSDSDAYITQHVPSEIGKTSPCSAATESIQDSSREHPGVAQKASSLTSIQTTVDTVSSNCKQIQLELKIPEPPCSLQTSLSLLSDSNNNTKASMKGVETGEGVGCFSRGAQGNYECNERIICPMVEPSTNVTTDPLEDVDKPQEDSEVSLSSLDHGPNWSSEDSESVLGKDLASHSHLSLAHADEQTEKSIEDNAVIESLEYKCSNAERNEGLKPLTLSLESRGLLVDFHFKEEKHCCSQPGDYSLPNTRRGSLSESFEEYALAEECRDHTQVSLPASQQEVRVVRYSYPDVSINLLAVSSLEPILEAERSLENCGTTEDDLKIETNKKYMIIEPAEEVRDNNLLGDISCKNPHHQSEQGKESLTTAELKPEENPATPVLRSSSENRCRRMTVAHDAVSYTSASSNCDESEDPHFVISARNANPDKMTKRSKIKDNQTGNKSSKFSVFAKMPSFRKAKGSKGTKSDEVPQESSDGGGEGLLPEQGPQRDNSADEVFVRGDILNQTVHQGFSSLRYEIAEEDCGFFPSTPYTHHVQQLVNQGSRGEGKQGPSPDNPLLRHVQSPNGQTYKSSKSNDSLNIRMRFAQAQKSISSLFESRSIDKENEGQATLGIYGNSSKAKQSWRNLKKAKEAELLKRTLSVPDGEFSNTASGQDRGDLTSSPLHDRLSSPGSPSSLRALRHTDPISKRGVPQGCGKENLHECKSEGQRRKCSPYSPPTTLCVSGLPPFLDDSAVSLPNHTSPVSPSSPCSLAILTHQLSPSWTRSHPVASEGLTESPLRPMSPKPNSPRPAAQHNIFRYPHSARASSVSPVLLGQSVSVETLTDPPERPKTLKPSASPLDVAEGRIDRQSHISLYAIGSINKLEVRKKTCSSFTEKIFVKCKKKCLTSL